MEKSFLSHLRELQSIDGDLYDAITAGTEPVDMKIENMEDDTLGFSVLYLVEER
jgi:hypothetical protein